MDLLMTFVGFLATPLVEHGVHQQDAEGMAFFFLIGFTVTFIVSLAVASSEKR